MKEIVPKFGVYCGVRDEEIRFIDRKELGRVSIIPQNPKLCTEIEPCVFELAIVIEFWLICRR